MIAPWPAGFANTAREFVRTLARDAVAFALPLHCAACATALDANEPGVICGRCWSRCVQLPRPQCDRCGHPRPAAGGRCRWCDLLPPFVRAARSWCWVPERAGGEIVHALKYRGWRATADGMAERMARLDWPRDVVAERTMLAPVPLAASRQRERGFNQSALLAAALAARWNVPLRADVVTRRASTESQTRLTPEERRRNVHGCFATPISARGELRGAHVVIVDDVVTTAATLNACAAALLDGGARIVSYVTFGRARASGDRFAS